MLSEEKKDFLFEVISVEIDWDMDYQKLVFGCKVKLKMRIGNRIKLGFASSRDGQINAFDVALRQIIKDFYPEIDNVSITNFSVQLAEGTEKKGTAGYVRVKITVNFENDSRDFEGMGADLVATAIDTISTAYNYAISEIINRKKEVLV